MQTVDITRMREHNASLLLNLVWKEAQISRADLARQTGMSRSTVSAIVNELIGARLVEETGPGDSCGGRRPQLLRFNDDAYRLVGVDMGASHVCVVVTNLRGRLLSQEQQAHPVVDDPQGTLLLIGRMIESCLANLPASPAELLGIGVAVPCPVDVDDPERLDSRLMPAWAEVDPQRQLRARYGCPVYMDNDANLGALAERWWGAGTSGVALTYIKIATGVGAGHIINGSIYRGAGGTAGEIGHTAIDPRGPRCRCGLYGCLATMIGKQPLVERAEGFLELGRVSTLARRDIDVGSIVAAAFDGDALATQIVAEAGSYLGIAIANLLNLLNPAIVVLGGDLTEAGDMLLEPIRTTIRQRSLWRSVADARIVTSALGGAAIATGAATLGLEAALSDLSLFATAGQASAV